MGDKEVLACLFSRAKHLKKLHRLEEFMVSKPSRKLFNVLKNSTERDLVKLVELGGVKASLVAEIVILSQEISWNGAIVDSDIDNFVEGQYRRVISAYNQKGQTDKVLQTIAHMEKAPVTNITDGYKKHLKEYEKIAEGGMLGMSTGLRGLDGITYGLAKGHIWVIGAYYGYGKTFFALNLISQLVSQRKKVQFITLEMSSNEIIDRLVGMRARLSPIEVLQGKLEKEKQLKREEAQWYWLEMIEEGYLVIDSDSRSTDDIITKVTLGDRFDCLVLDYLQLISTGKDQYEGLREAMKSLQELTVSQGISSVFLSQISNQSQREGENTKVDGFKGAGDIGQVANIAIKLVREKQNGDWTKWYGLDVVKNRHGKIGKVTCKIDFPGGIISDLTSSELLEWKNHYEI